MTREDIDNFKPFTSLKWTIPMNGVIQLLCTNGPLEFEDQPVQVEDLRQIAIILEASMEYALLESSGFDVIFACQLSDILIFH